MLGHEVIREFAGDRSVHFTSRSPEVAATMGIPGEVHRFEAIEDDVTGLIGKLEPRVVVNALGIVKQVRDAERPVPAIRVNSLLPHELAEAAADVGARLVHISTDCVFSGGAPLGYRYTEEDAPGPLDLYGRSKLLGETDEGEALTLRTSIIGWELNRQSGLLEWLASQDGKTIGGFRHAIFSGLTTRALARVIRSVIEDARDLSGVYHVASKPISKLDLLLLLKQALGLSCEIEPHDQPVVNRALNGSRFSAATGIEVPSWEDMAAEYRHERSPRLGAANA